MCFPQEEAKHRGSRLRKSLLADRLAGILARRRRPPGEDQWADDGAIGRSRTYAIRQHAERRLGVDRGRGSERAQRKIPQHQLLVAAALAHALEGRIDEALTVLTSVQPKYSGESAFSSKLSQLSQKKKGEAL